MIVRKTHPEETTRVEELFAVAFEIPLDRNKPTEENDSCCHWAAFSEDGELMSTLTISDVQVHFDGHSCKMGGIGGVATLPCYRRRGGIRSCFNAALSDLYHSGYDFSYLYPFSTTYYRKFGYESCVQQYSWEVDLALLDPPEVNGTFYLLEERCPMTDAIRAVDTTLESRFNMMVRHGERDYTWTMGGDPAVKQEFTYVCFDDKEFPAAYTTFKTVQEGNKRNINCSRFCFFDRDGFMALMALFKNLSANHDLVKFRTPANSALQYLLPEWSMGAVKWDLVHNFGMVRVVHVRSVLEKARYIGHGRVTLNIRDEQISENNGCFAVTFADDKAVSVLTVDSNPDVVLTISTFSALIAGVCDFDEARCTFSGLEVKEENSCLRQVFYRKPLMISDSF